MGPMEPLLAVAALLALQAVPGASGGPGLLAPAASAPAQEELTLDQSEAIASFAGAVLGRFAEDWREHGDPLADPGATGFLAEVASVGTVAQVSEAAVGSPAGDRWLVALAPEEQRRVLEGPGAVARSVRAAFDRLGERLGGRPTRPMEIALKAVRPDPDLEGEYEVDARVRAVGPEGDIVVHGWWTTRWIIEGDQRRLLGVVPRMREVLQADPARPRAFEDVAGSVLQGPGAAALARGIGDLRGRLDVSFGVGVLGHHGVAVADANGDGIDDLYVCQPGGVPNQLWLRRPDCTAVEAAGAAGLDFLDASSSALLVDLDGDGDRDLALASGAGLDLFVRTDTGYVRAARFERPGITGLAAADVDLDGRLDLYACAYAGPYTGGALPMPYHDAENGERNMLLMNRGGGRDRLVFADELEARGLAVGATRFSFAAAFEDVDLDGDIDLYVANDFGRNALYVNDGAGRFHEAAEASGVVDIAAGMGVAFADLDGNGTPDLYVSNMESSAGRRVTGAAAFRPAISPELDALFRGHAKGNSLYLGRGDGTFDATRLAEAGRWAWGSIPVDLDGNGALDLYVPNGFVTGTDKERPDL